MPSSQHKLTQLPMNDAGVRRFKNRNQLHHNTLRELIGERTCHGGFGSSTKFLLFRYPNTLTVHNLVGSQPSDLHALDQQRQAKKQSTSCTWSSQRMCAWAGCMSYTYTRGLSTCAQTPSTRSASTSARHTYSISPGGEYACLDLQSDVCG
jgi:hypothetical protein